MLKRAFNQIISSDAVRFADKEADRLVIRSYILEYARKHGAEVSCEEIDAFITAQQSALDSLVRDFTYRTKMMN
ncbi:MAG: hypothetical protein ACI4LA_04730 [Emergencia sp.]